MPFDHETLKDYLERLNAFELSINPPLPPNPCWTENGINHGTPRFHLGQQVLCRYADTPTKFFEFLSIIRKVRYPVKSNKSMGPSYAVISVPAGAKIAWYSESQLRSLDTFAGDGDGI